MSGPIQTVFVVDDDPAFLASMRRLLKIAGYRTECFGSPQDFLKRSSGALAGCVILDLHMPELNGLMLQRVLNKSGNSLPVIYLTGNGDIRTSVTAMRQGAEDFLLKTTPKEQIFAAIERAFAIDKERWRLKNRCREIKALFDDLTGREIEILDQLLLGRANKLIGTELGITERSVKRHRTRIMHKLNVNNLVELVNLVSEAQDLLCSASQGIVRRTGNRR